MLGYEIQNITCKLIYMYMYMYMYMCMCMYMYVYMYYMCIYICVCIYVYAQHAVCQSHTGHMTGLWFLPTRPLRLNTNE